MSSSTSPSAEAGKGKFTMRLGYAASDVAGQLVFAFVSFYLLYFYTEVFGLSAAVAGTILFAARLIDALEAPLWGIIFDRTKSRWGKHRPWFLWLCLPFATFGVLTFLTPELEHNQKVAYAAITYIGCSVLYTGINTPVTSILSALTADPRERVILTCFRMFGSKLGVLIVNLAGLRLVAFLGEGDDRRGFMLAIPIYAIGTVLLYLFAFRTLREREETQVTQRMSLRTSFGALRGNWPWMIIFATSLLFWVGFISRVAAAPYFFEYVVGRKDLIPWANALDFVSLVAVLMLPRLCLITSKRNIWAFGLVGMVLGQSIVYVGLLNGGSVAWVLSGWAIGFLASGAAMAMPFSVLSDSVDYGEWKTGIRAAGLLTSIGAAFCLKAGSGLGAALPGWVMDAGGYVANSTQTPGALQAITFCVVGLPALCFLAGLLPLAAYGKYEAAEAQIRRELEERHAKAANASA